MGSSRPSAAISGLRTTVDVGPCVSALPNSVSTEGRDNAATRGLSATHPLGQNGEVDLVPERVVGTAPVVCAMTMKSCQRSSRTGPVGNVAMLHHLTS